MSSVFDVIAFASSIWKILKFLVCPVTVIFKSMQVIFSNFPNKIIFIWNNMHRFSAHHEHCCPASVCVCVCLCHVQTFRKPNPTVIRTKYQVTQVSSWERNSSKLCNPSTHAFMFYKNYTFQQQLINQRTLRYRAVGKGSLKKKKQTLYFTVAYSGSWWAEPGCKYRHFCCYCCCWWNTTTMDLLCFPDFEFVLVTLQHPKLGCCICSLKIAKRGNQYNIQK